VDDVTGKWCILRTNGARTLALAASLNGAGIEAWTPQVMKRRKHLGKRVAPAHVERPAPLLPTFVFARAEHLEVLKVCAKALSNPHPAFSVFRYNGRFPAVSDQTIEGLRTAERRAVPKQRQRTFPKGAQVKPSEGAYAGLTGIVRESDGRYTLVAFGSWMDVKIDTFLLSPNDVRPVS
jgi:hypothetical protein